MALGDLIQSLSADPAQAQANILTPDQIKRRQAMADALTKEGTSYAPVQSWTQGAARLAAALNGRMQESRADNAAKANASWFQSQLPGLLGSDASAAATPSASPATPSPAGGGSNYADAIAAVESRGSGDYGAIGPKTRTGDQGHGRYQVMGANIPEWTQAALGRPMSPQEFLADPKAQDAVFNHRFGMYLQKYGNPQDAASAWFTGGPLSTGANKSDVLGTTGNRYVDKFMTALGGARPVQVASADPQQAMAYIAQPASGGASAPAQTAIDAANVPTPPVRPPELTPSASPFGGLSQAGLMPDAKAKLNAAMAAKSDSADEEDDNMPATKTVAAPAPAAATPVAAQSTQATAGASQARQMQILRMMADPRVSPEQRQVLGLLYQAANKDTSPDTAVVGKNLVDKRTGRVIFTAPAGTEDESQPATVREYEYAKKNGFKGSFEDWQNKKAMKFANFDTDADKNLVESLATRLIKGDTTWKTGLAKDPGLIRRVETRAAEMGKDMEGGFNADTILQNRANQAGRVKEQGTLGTSTANNTLYGNAAAATIDTAIKASRDLPRTDWVPVNKLLQMGEKSVSNPKLAAFRTALLTTVNDYAKATTPTGTPTDSQRNHAYEVLNTAVGPEGVEAVLRMMHREIANTHNAIDLTKKQLQSGKGGHLPDLTAPPAGPDVPGSQATGIWDSIKNAVGAGGKPPIAVQSPEDARKLPPGTMFQTPDGRTFTR